jgi:uncharacterized protein (DUF58 family)
VNISRHILNITPQGQIVLVLSFIGGLLGMNFGLVFLWLPSFALILYFLPFFYFRYSDMEFSAFRLFSASTVTLGGFLHCRLRIINPLKDANLTVTFENRYSEGVILVKGWTHSLIQLKPGEKRDFSFIFTFEKRGYHEFFPLLIYRSDPLGFYRDSYEVEDTVKIRVIPARPQHKLSKKQKKDVRDTLAGYHGYRRRGQGDEFFSLREYVRGDEPRRIYWKASARQGKLISKEFSDEVVFRILVAIDMSWTMRSRKLEYALTTLLELAEMSAQNNDAFGFILFDEIPKKFLKPQKSARLYEKTARLTYDQHASNKHGHFQSILPFVFSLKGTRGFLIVVSDSEGILDDKIKAITQLAKFGHRIVFIDIRGEYFGKNIPIQHLNTVQKIKHLDIVKEKISRKYSSREQKLRETLNSIGGTYLHVESGKQNLLLMLRKEFSREEMVFPHWMVQL